MSEPRHRAASRRIDYRLTFQRSLAVLAPFVPRRRRRTYLATLGVTGAAAVTAAILLPGGGQPAAQAVLRLPMEPNEAHVQHIILPQVQAPLLSSSPSAPADYTIRPGDTLAGIAARLCGNPDDFRALAANNHIRYANQISAGDVIKVACHAAVAALARVQLAPPLSPAAPASGPVLAAATEHVQGAAQPSVQSQSQSSGGEGGTLGCSGLEQLWDAAGGNPQDAFMAAEIAMAESGGNQYALSPTDDRGYWQINASNGALSTYDALGNAHAAITLSDDGTNWGAWTTYTAGLYVGKC